MPSIHLAAGSAPSSRPLYGNRSKRNSGSDFRVYPVDMAADQSGDGLPRWLVIDSRGRIVARAHSELLAIAKMQILLLTKLTSSPRAGTMARPQTNWPVP